MTTHHAVPLYLDLAPESTDFTQEIVDGLTASPKSLPSKLFYDERGSDLFDRICELDAYYPTRTEIGILKSHLDSITDRLGDSVILVEYGSGSSIKTRLLLKAIPDVTAYLPIDISREHLLKASEHIKIEFPSIDVLPVCADYSQQIRLGLHATEGTRLSVFFPGSTIGNFQPAQAVAFMRRVRALVGPGGGLLIGVDLVKNHSVLERAYNDEEGITAAFNRNILHHVNHLTDADFRPDAFDHHAPYVEAERRIEMHLVATERMNVSLAGRTIHFEKGESILTEYSHKYTRDQFARLADEAGFDVDSVWTDEKDWFSVQYLRAR